MDELTNLKRIDITMTKSGCLKVSIQDSKTGPRSFLVHPSDEKHLNAVQMYQDYLAILPKNLKSDRVWLRMEKWQDSRQNSWKEQHGRYSKEIARFLGFPNPENYTSHSIRRTGVTILAENGFTTEALWQYGGWKNASTAQIYIENTESNKERIAEAVLDPPTLSKKPFVPHSFTTSNVGVHPPPPPNNNAPITSMISQATLNNCVIHIHHETAN